MSPRVTLLVLLAAVWGPRFSGSDQVVADPGPARRADLATPGPPADPHRLEQTQEAWSAVVLDCPLTPDPTTDPEAGLTFAWITPNHHLVFYDPESNLTSSLTPEQSEVIFEECVPETAFVVTDDEHLEVLSNGSLVIDFFGWGDRGYYQCLALDRADNSSRSSRRFYVSLEHHFRNHVYYFSNLYAVTAAVGFLLLTLLYKLVYFLLETYGCCLCCCCCENRLPPKARKIKHALDSIEAYKQQQLDKLRDNYTQQSDWIRENCAAQMDRVRDNYNSQVQNIRDIRQFGSTHISAVREQYYEQMNRIRDYSTSQLDRAHENYIFQRQRLRKFSAQNYLRMRATGQYTQRTLGRVMENIPPLYLDLTNCRQGMGGRATSIHLYPEDFQIAELAPLDENEAGLERHPHLKRILEGNPDDDGSLYFTPEGTPLREVDSHNSLTAKFRKPSSLEGTPLHDVAAPGMMAANSNGHFHKGKCHRKSKSFSNFLPTSWPFSWGADSGGAYDEPQMEAVRVSRPPPKAGGGGGGGGGGQRQQVQAVVEHVAASNDYLDTSSASKEDDEGASAATAGTPLLKTSVSSEEKPAAFTSSRGSKPLSPSKLKRSDTPTNPSESSLEGGSIQTTSTDDKVEAIVVDAVNEATLRPSGEDGEEDRDLERIIRPEEIAKFIDDPACSVTANIDLGHEAFRELRESAEDIARRSGSVNDIESLAAQPSEDGVRLRRKKSVV